MIQVANELPENCVLSGDICLIGAGAAGIAIALELAASGLEVILLEAGDREPSASTQDMYAGEVVDERLHSPPDRYRQRRFGGTTTIWGGRCVPFDAIDFEARDFIADSGWPFTLSELAPYYPRANRLCEAGRFEYTAETAFEMPLPPMIENFHSSNFTSNTLERFSCPTDFGARYGKKLKAARNLRVILHANVTAIQLDAAGGRVQSATARTLTGRSFSVRCGQFVLATGGLEVARLLLANRDVQPNGIGNDCDVVGRYYMCHLVGTLGTLWVNGFLSSVCHGYDISDEGVYC